MKKLYVAKRLSEKVAVKMPMFLEPVFLPFSQMTKGLVGALYAFDSVENMQKYYDKNTEAFIVEMADDYTATPQQEQGKGDGESAGRSAGVASLRRTKRRGSGRSNRGVVGGVQERTEVRSKQVVQASGKKRSEGKAKGKQASRRVHPSKGNTARGK